MRVRASERDDLIKIIKHTWIIQSHQFPKASNVKKIKALIMDDYDKFDIKLNPDWPHGSSFQGWPTRFPSVRPNLIDV